MNVEYRQEEYLIPLCEQCMSKNELKLFSLRIICSNVYLYKMKLIFKSQYTLLIWRLVVHHQYNIATSKKTSISEV